MLTLEQERERQRLKSRKWYQSATNRDKRLAYMKAHRLGNLASYRARHREWRSGWTQAQFDAAWVAQQGRCAICDIEMGALGRKGHSVTSDHDHQTNRPRGLLCRVCNSKLAPLEDAPWREKAERYLKGFSQ